MVKKRVAVLISGRGSNMAALIEAARAPRISGRDFARPVEPARGGGACARRSAGRTDGSGRPSPARKRSRRLRTCAPGRCSMSMGWSSFASAVSCDCSRQQFALHWHGRMINIHPSLLPSFPGLDPHGQAFEAGVKISGATVHFVGPRRMPVPIIAQAAVPVRDDDNVETLAARVLDVEHRVYPLALSSLADGSVKVVGARCLIEGVDRAEGEVLVPSPSSSRPRARPASCLPGVRCRLLPRLFGQRQNKPPAHRPGATGKLVAGGPAFPPRHDTLRFSADVLPRLVTSSYSTV